MKEGDATAFKTLYDRYWEQLYLKACQRVDKDEAKDIVQEVMTTLWRRRGDIFTFDDGQIGRYLFTAVKYRVITHKTTPPAGAPMSVYDACSIPALMQVVPPEK